MLEFGAIECPLAMVPRHMVMYVGAGRSYTLGQSPRFVLGPAMRCMQPPSGSNVFYQRLFSSKPTTMTTSKLSWLFRPPFSATSDKKWRETRAPSPIFPFPHSVIPLFLPPCTGSFTFGWSGSIELLPVWLEGAAGPNFPSWWCHVTRSSLIV